MFELRTSGCSAEGVWAQLHTLKAALGLHTLSLRTGIGMLEEENNAGIEGSYLEPARSLLGSLSLLPHRPHVLVERLAGNEMCTVWGINVKYRMVIGYKAM